MSTTASNGLSPVRHQATVHSQTTNSRETKRKALDFNSDKTSTKAQKKDLQESSEDQELINRLLVILKKQNQLLENQKRLDESFQLLDKNVDLLGAEQKKLDERVQGMESILSLILRPNLRLYDSVVEPSDDSAMRQSASDC